MMELVVDDQSNRITTDELEVDSEVDSLSKIRRLPILLWFLPAILSMYSYFKTIVILFHFIIYCVIQDTHKVR